MNAATQRQALLGMQTSGDGHAAMSSPAPGPNGSFPVAHGNMDLYAAQGPLANGSFELGTAGWQDYAGIAILQTGSMINGIAGTNAPDGTLFGCTESDRNTGGPWAEWGHPFCPAEGDTTTVTFQWQVVTEEYGDCSNSEPPYLRLYLLRDEGRTLAWTREWADFCGMLSPTSSGDRATGWQPATVSITGEATVNPDDELLLFDLGANWVTYETSWFLIDDVSFSR